MAFGLKLRKFPKDEIKQRVEEAARILDITELLDRRPKALSGGQRQRVAMGRAIVRNPKVFLFDEPLSNLDAKLRVQMRTEIKRVHQKVKTTTVYVTHDQVEAMTLADRVVVMNHGRDRADRHAAGALSPPANALRRRLHRLAGDELHSLPAGAERRGPARARFGHHRPAGAGGQRARATGASAGRELLFGLRPEHLTEPRHNGQRQRLRVRGRARRGRADGHGDDGLFHGERHRGLRPGRSRERGRSAGAMMPLRANMEHMHLIDPASGTVL